MVQAEQWPDMQKTSSLFFGGRLGGGGGLWKRGWKNYVVFWVWGGAPQMDLLKPLWLVYAKQSAGIGEGDQARTSPLCARHIHPHLALHTLMPSFFFFTTTCPLKSKSTHIHIPPILLPLPTSPFLLLLPCKDNQVYVKYVCSFDSWRYLINSITPSAIVPRVFEMRTGEGGPFLILSINVNIFGAVAMASAKSS